jgi:hypothetical protein
MNCFTPHLITAFALSCLSVAAIAADVPSRDAVPAQGANQAASSAAPSPVSRANAKGASTGAADASVRKMFCLNMSMQCFTLSQQATSAFENRRHGCAGLRARDIRRIVPEVELRALLPDPYEMHEAQEQVQVEGTRPEIYVPAGLMTLPWAVMHPTQAWRIFLPVPAAQTK